jgi:ADP-ribosylglycohydrolase
MGLLDAAYQVTNGRGLYPTSHLAEAGAKIARTTHLHPLGYLPAALMTLLISRVVPLAPEEVKDSVFQIVEDGLDMMMTMEGNEHYGDKEYLRELTLRAVDLAKSDIPDADAIRQLGEGWTAEEAWAVSLYCALRHIDSMKDAIIAAVNHDGDSDSTGSITGNIMGTIYGYEAIIRERLFCPEGKSFDDTIELHNIILALADDLYTGCIISEYDPIETPEKKQWYARYCEMKPVGV